MFILFLSLFHSSFSPSFPFIIFPFISLHLSHSHRNPPSLMSVPFSFCLSSFPPYLVFLLSLVTFLQSSCPSSLFPHVRDITPVNPIFFLLIIFPSLSLYSSFTRSVSALIHSSFLIFPISIHNHLPISFSFYLSSPPHSFTLLSLTLSLLSSFLHSSSFSFLYTFVCQPRFLSADPLSLSPPLFSRCVPPITRPSIPSSFSPSL